MTTTIDAITAPGTAPVITIDQATQLGLAVHHQLHRPDLGAISPLGFVRTDVTPALDDDGARTAALGPSFDWFVSVGLLTAAEAAALTAVLLGTADPQLLPPVDPTVVGVYQVFRLAVRHGAATVTFDFWDFVGDLAEVVAGAALGFIAAGPAGAVAGGALALMEVLDR